ncbi:MAG: PEGA domain-containing protein [Deltaproteobacteria bacterium]|nr:PEGA domain-containing protein [Deltaproteobacteria bacterium]
MTKRPRIICFVLALNFFFFQFPLGWAKRIEVYDPKKVSVAVLPNPASSQDRALIEETADSVRKDLKAIPYFHVVDPKTVQNLMDYHSISIQRGSMLTDAERYLGLSKSHWFDREYAEAEATVNRAISSLERQPEKGALLVDALLTKAMIFQETRRQAESKEVFQKVLAINPQMTLEGLPVAGRSRSVFRATKSDLVGRHSGSLEIKTNPPAAIVYLNGIRKGVTPLTLAGLPEGSYLMTLEASRYETASEPVVVTASTTQFINRKMQWSGAGGSLGLGRPAKSDKELQDEIKFASQIGETLKVDKVILVTSQHKDGKPMVVVRTVDTALKSAYNPIGMPFEEMLENKEKAVARITEDLDDQARLNVLDNPQDKLEPDMGDVRVLRRGVPLFKKPLFLAFVGAIVGGAIGATAGILLTKDSSDGSSGDAGGVDITFE